MPQVDVQWPSEDEDSDAKDNKEGSKSATVKTAPAISEDVEESDQKQDSDEHSKEESEQPEPEEAEQPKEEESTDEESTSEATASVEPVVSVDVPVVSDKQTSQPTAKTSGPKKNHNAMFRLVGEAILVLAVVVLGLWSWSLYNDRKDLQTQVANLNVNPQTSTQKQTQILVTQVGRLMQLPTDETPTVVEVSNADQAKKQSAFFANAQNGDKALLYLKTGEAILFRPSTDKIILVAPISYSNSGAATTKTTTTTK